MLAGAGPGGSSGLISVSPGTFTTLPLAKRGHMIDHMQLSASCAAARVWKAAYYETTLTYSWFQWVKLLPDHDTGHVLTLLQEACSQWKGWASDGASQMALANTRRMTTFWAAATLSAKQHRDSFWFENAWDKCIYIPLSSKGIAISGHKKTLHGTTVAVPKIVLCFRKETLLCHGALIPDWCTLPINELNMAHAVPKSSKIYRARICSSILSVNYLLWQMQQPP